MKRWMLRQLWPYIRQQLEDVAVILYAKWKVKPANSMKKLRADLFDAAEWVLLHGRPPEDYPTG